jgi:hypothetical protein
MPKTVKSLSTLRNALALFGLSGTTIAACVPYLFAGSKSPDFALFFVVGMAIILLTAVLFNYIDRLGMGFGKTTLVLATGYNALIAAIKLGLAPAALYELNQMGVEFPFLLSVFLPFIGIAILLLYLVVFSVMYQEFKQRLSRRVDTTALKPERTLFTLGVALSVFVVVLTAISILEVVVFRSLSVLGYVVILLTSMGVAILLALVLAAILAATTFGQVKKRAEELGQATLLANFFWLGCILIALYHAMWLIFLLTLFSIWPLRTYSPK